MYQILLSIVTIIFAEIGVCDVVPEGFLGGVFIVLACVVSVIAIVVIHEKFKPVVYVNETEYKKVNHYRKHRRQHHR